MDALTESAGPMRAKASLLGWFVALLLLTLVAAVPLELGSQAVLGVLFFCTAWFASRLRGRSVGLFLIAISLTVTFRYFAWRLGSTLGDELSVDLLASGVLLLAETYALVMLLIGYFQSAWLLPRKPVPLVGDPSSWPTVDVFIPTYNEPLSVVRATVLAAKALDWPRERLRIYLLDDGKREAFRTFAMQAGVGYFVRKDNRHAKAGNLNHALSKTKGDLIAIFDCDHVPTRSFLQMTVGWFQRDGRMAMVQTPHHFYSPDPFERNLGIFRKVPNEGELFYGSIQSVNDLWNAAFFCGSCAVLRRTALEEVGGIATETVTEDAHTALKMHRRGYTTAFLPVVQAAGLATESLSAHVGQRIRWARGMAQIFRIDNPLLGRGLSLGQRISYLGSMLHFFHAAPRLIFLISPLFFLLFGLHILEASPQMVLAYWLPHMALVILTNSKLQGSHRHSFWSDLYETCLTVYIVIPTTLALIAPGSGTFNVTAKGGLVHRLTFDWKIAIPYLALSFLCLAGLVAGLFRLATGAGHPGVVGINMAWTLLNLVILAGTLGVAREQRQVRKQPRILARLPAMLRLASRHTWRSETRDISMGGVSLVVDGVRTFRKGERITTSILGQGEERPFPCRVVRQDGTLLRLEWDSLSQDEEEALVRDVFSRPGGWVDWSEGRQEDRPLGSLFRIFLQGLSFVGGLGRRNSEGSLGKRAKARA